MKKALYSVVNGHAYGRLTAEGEKVWNIFKDTVKEVKKSSFFDDCDDGELADMLAEEFPRVNRYDIYDYLMFYGD